MGFVRLSVFDLDHTLLKVNSSFRYYLYLLKLKVFNFSSFFYALKYFFKFYFSAISPYRLHCQVFDRFLIGQSRENITRYVDRFWDIYFSRFCYMPAIRRLNFCRGENHYVVVLSNSPSFLIQPVAERLKVDEFRATQYGVDDEGNFSRVIKFVGVAEKRAYTLEIARRLHIGRENITAYSDSIWDISWLQSVGNPIAVYPDRKLKKIAERENWEII